MLTPSPILLADGHVRLEPMHEAHVAGLLVAAGDPELWRWMPKPQPRSEDDVRKLYATHPGLPWTVVVDGVPAGSTSYLDLHPEVGGLEIGWTWYRRDLWATSVNPACKLLLLAHAFDDLGADRVSLKTDALNVRSRAAISKLGVKYDGTLRHHMRRADGTVRDTAYFSLLAAEWPAVRQGLKDRLSRG
ncbi:MAG: GNAT family protein [Mycobacteriales bacterium]